MSWQIAITLQVIASSFMTLLSRRITLSARKVFFGIALISYFMIALMGFLYALTALHTAPAIPAFHAWRYLLIEGICIPTAWLIQYRTISYIGAGNAVVVSTLNTVSAALAGILFFRDPLSAGFVFGGLCIITGALASLRLPADTQHHTSSSLLKKSSLVIAGALFFAIGMAAEKEAITIIGVWDYATYGWGMQLVGATILFSIFGRHELPHLSGFVIKRGALLGVVTSIAGGLYIYALSKGSLSHTMIASSGKIAITVLLAAIFLGERNNFKTRVLAFWLSIIGLWLVVH